MATTPAKFYYSGNWVRFSLINGIYDNFLSFLEGQGLTFLGEMAIDWTNIPTTLHGKGNSHNLYQYIANNNDNPSLIRDFLNYFIREIAIFKYALTNNYLNFSIALGTTWQSSNFYSDGYSPPLTTTTTTLAPTTTTTTTIYETTTSMPMSMSMFDLFGQLHNL